jgi:hypothetical protein
MNGRSVTEIRLAMHTNGYDPLPCSGKIPAPLAWQTKIGLSADEIRQMALQFPHATNTGACCERTPALDVDIGDPGAAEAVRNAINDWFGERGDVIFRVGRPPKFLVPFRTDEPFPKMKREFHGPNDATYRLEFLGHGQQFIAAGIHPDLHKAYQWPGGHSLENTPRASLPEITESEATELLDYLTDLLVEQFDFTPLQDQDRDPDASEFIVQAKDTVDVEQELAAIHYGNIHDTWKRCMGALLRGGMAANDTVRQLKAAAEQSPACQADPKRKLWPKALAAMVTWYVRTDPGFIVSLAAKQQQDWHARLAEGLHPRLVWRDDHGLQVRGDGHDGTAAASGTTTEQPEQPEQPKEPPTKEEPPKEPKKYKFPLLRFGDMRPGTEANYQVDELIPLRGLIVVYGAPKSGKSFWTLDVTLHIALGWEYRERAVQQGTVIYCAFEGAHGYRKRCEAFRRHHMLTAEDDPPLYVVPGRADLIKDHAALIRDIKGQLAEAAATVRCVVLDTLNKSLIGSESKDVDMANYIAAAEAIQAAFCCAVIIVHHHGIDETRPRGHTSLRGAVDALIKVVRDDQNIIIVEIEDMRDGPEGTQLLSKLVVVDVGADNAGRPLTSAVIEPLDPNNYRSDGRKMPKLSANQRTMFSILDAAPAGLTTDEWNEQARGAGLGTKRRADLHDLRVGLKTRGLVCENSGRWFVAPKFKVKLD